MWLKSIRCANLFLMRIMSSTFPLIRWSFSRRYQTTSAIAGYTYVMSWEASRKKRTLISLKRSKNFRKQQSTAAYVSRQGHKYIEALCRSTVMTIVACSIYPMETILLPVTFTKWKQYCCPSHLPNGNSIVARHIYPMETVVLPVAFTQWNSSVASSFYPIKQ